VRNDAKALKDKVRAIIDVIKENQNDLNDIPYMPFLKLIQSVDQDLETLINKYDRITKDSSQSGDKES
jgi:hypothetical protein